MKIYTGSYTVDPGYLSPTLPQVLSAVDAYTANHQTTINMTALTKARKAQQQADALHTTMSTTVADLSTAAATAGQQYAAGKITAEQVVSEAVTGAALRVSDVLTEAVRLINNAAGAVESVGLAELRKVTERQWLDAARPVVDAALAAAHHAADATGIDAPKYDAPGVRTRHNPWAPSDRELAGDTRLRHAWELLGEALDALEGAYTLTDLLRDYGMIPTANGRHVREDYRWLHRDRLEGDPCQRGAFWLANRKTAEPGLFTTAELDEADTSADADWRDRPVQTDRYDDRLGA